MPEVVWQLPCAMGLDSLLGDYDSDDDQSDGKDAASAPVNTSSGNRAQGMPATNELSLKDDGEHGCFCDCEDCKGFLARFAAKNLQTKGVRFRCKMCGDMVGAKAAASQHFLRMHAADLQDFKQKKGPHLFRAVPRSDIASVLMSRTVSFAREDVLRKRPTDVDSSFGGWAKKAKPEPPPCESEAYQAAVAEPIFTPPPWEGKSRPTDDDATDMDKDVDRRIAMAQLRRFCTRNILEITPKTVRCKLCYKTLGSSAETERHIVEAHQDDFLKEQQIWERFLHTSCRRQPPFGWVCKVCQIFFPSDGAVWRHVGKEVFIRREERHLETWHQKEDRWGHEEDEECCGDGMNVANGLSYDSVRKLQEEARRLQEDQEARQMDASAARYRGSNDGDSEDEEDAEDADGPKNSKCGKTGDEGLVTFINEF